MHLETRRVYIFKLRSLYITLLGLGCPAKRIFFLSVRIETNRNTGSFGSVSVFFPKEYNYLFRFVSVVSVFRNRFETNRN
jgi:hypothetical protein